MEYRFKFLVDLAKQIAAPVTTMWIGGRQVQARVLYPWASGRSKKCGSCNGF